MDKFCPKHVELILEINKFLLLHLFGFLYYFTYIDDARSDTNQVFIKIRPVGAALFQADGQTDMAKLLAPVGNFCIRA
jgi:hypothetical protein